MKQIILSVLIILFFSMTSCVENEKKEMDVICAFLPKQLSDEEVKRVCQETVKSLGATSMKDMGKIMGALKSKHADTIDFSKVSPILKELLN